MPPWKSETYSLLNNNPSQDAERESLDDEVNAAAHQMARDGFKKHGALGTKRYWCLISALLLSLTTNVIFATAFISVIPRLSQVVSDKTVLGGKSSTYASLTEDPLVQYPWSTGFGPEVTNHSLADDRWEAIDIDDGIILLDDDYVLEHNLSPSQRFPWDASKGVYLLNSFHNLHCLKNIHRLLYDAHHGRPLSRDIGHAMHCVDHMRKDIYCNADDFPLPSPPSRHELPGPRGQTKVCKNWDALVAWAKQRNACYAHITDDEAGFAEGHKEIERYRNCPPDSPYYETMKEYFATH